MKNQNVGLTTANWILSILGIILLSCVIILPPIFRVFFKEEEIIESLPEKIDLQVTACEKKDILMGQYTYNEILTFYFTNDKIHNYSRDVERIYRDFDSYSNDKQLFGRYATAFSILSGYKFSVNPDDNNLVINIDELYELNVFKETTITIPGDNYETNVTSIYMKDQSVEEVVNSLTIDGYICK